MSTRPGPLGQRLAAEIRAELGRQNRSRRWLAEQVGVPHNTLSRWVAGDTSPGVDYMNDMCVALGFTVSELLTAVQAKDHPGPHRRRSTDYLTIVAAA